MRGDKRHFRRRLRSVTAKAAIRDYRSMRDNIYIARYVGWQRPETRPSPELLRLLGFLA